MTMHPSNCMIDCESEDCTCNPKKQELINLAASDLLNAAKSALDYLKSRNLDGGQVGANLYNAISKATGTK